MGRDDLLPAGALHRAAFQLHDAPREGGVRAGGARRGRPTDLLRHVEAVAEVRAEPDHERLRRVAQVLDLVEPDRLLRVALGLEARAHAVDERRVLLLLEHELGVQEERAQLVSQVRLTRRGQIMRWGGVCHRGALGARKEGRKEVLPPS